MADRSTEIILTDPNGNEISPATEGKQDDIISAINDTSVSDDMEGKGKVAVGTTAVELTFTGTTSTISITADDDNTGTIYIGKSDVLTDGSNAFDKIEAGQSIVIGYKDSSNAVYVVGSAVSQNVWAGALK